MKTTTFLTYGFCIALGFLFHACQTAHAAIVFVNWTEPTNAVAAGVKDYTLTARSFDGTKQQWLGNPGVGTTNTTFESDTAAAKCGLPCMIAMCSNSTNGNSSAYGEWISFTTNAPPPVPQPPAKLMPPSALGYHF